MSDSVRPHRWQPTRLPRPWDSPGKNTGVGCHFPLQCMKVKSESEVTQSCPTLATPMDCSLSGFSVHGILQAKVLESGAIAFSNIYTTMCKTDSQWEAAIWTQGAQLGALWWPWGVGWSGGWWEAQEGGDIRILVADSHCCTAEANTMFESNYPPIKNKNTHTPKKNPFFSLKSIVFLHLICISILSYLAESISFFFFNFTVWEKSISLFPSNIVVRLLELSFVNMIGKVLHYF